MNSKDTWRAAGPLPEPAGDRLRPKEAARIGRTSVATIYVWGKEGKFRWWTVKRRGLERGIRYIDATSFFAFLESQKEEAPVT
jgi:hypothetical protein